MLFINVGLYETPPNGGAISDAKAKPVLIKQSTLIRMGLYEQLGEFRNLQVRNNWEF